MGSTGDVDTLRPPCSPASSAPAWAPEGPDSKERFLCRDTGSWGLPLTPRAPPQCSWPAGTPGTGPDAGSEAGPPVGHLNTPRGETPKKEETQATTCLCSFSCCRARLAQGDTGLSPLPGKARVRGRQEEHGSTILPHRFTVPFPETAAGDTWAHLSPPTAGL